MKLRSHIARPVTDLHRSVALYEGGLGLRELGRFEDHGDFDGVMLALGGAGSRETQVFNPYGVRLGRSFEDPDGCRVAIQRAAWPTANQETS